jgi:long-chain acyl-CoA synthetase
MSDDLSDLLPPGFPAMSIRDATIFLTQTKDSPLELGEATIRGVTYKIWKNAPPTLRDVFELPQQWPDNDYIVLEDERVTFAAHRKAVFRLAAQFRADGVKPGDRVAIVARNIPEWSVAFWAAVLVGAIVTPLNGWWTGAELEYGLADSGSKIIVADHERWLRISPHAANLPAIEKVYLCRTPEPVTGDKLFQLEDVIGKPMSWKDLPEGTHPDVALAPDDDVTIFYTSGTTGKPKGAVGSHRNIISNIYNAMSGQYRSFLRRGEMPPAPDPTLPRKATLLAVPFFHATGCFAVMIPAIMGGTKLVLQRRWDVDAALGLIEKEKINSAGGVPTIAWQILEHPRFEEFDLSSLETVSYGGAPSAPELVRRIKERFPKSQPGQGWGMTETSATATTNFAEDYIKRPTSCGVPAATGETRIMSPDEQEVPTGEVGELWYKGPINVRGYWNKPEATASTFVDGWVKTGDLARVDDEGFVYIVDRAKDMLIRGGENIYCIEVENALYDHDAVMDAAVIGRPHKTLGEEPVAVVHLKPDHSATEEELRAHVASKIAAFKVPVKILFLPDNLPRNANGKIMKRDLKPLFEGAA